MSEIKPNWKCSAEGPQNNGLLEACGFEYYFDPSVFSSPHCPKCGSRMDWVSTGLSVSQLLQKGLKDFERK
jgi:hypothetical protein